jgi:hypothetical protein
MRVMKRMKCHAKQMKVIGALQIAGALTCSLDGRQQQCDQNADCGNNHQQLKYGDTGGATNAMRPTVDMHPALVEGSQCRALSVCNKGGPQKSGPDSSGSWKSTKAKCGC